MHEPVRCNARKIIFGETIECTHSIAGELFFELIKTKRFSVEMVENNATCNCVNRFLNINPNTTNMWRNRREIMPRMFEYVVGVRIKGIGGYFRKGNDDICGRSEGIECHLKFAISAGG